MFQENIENEYIVTQMGTSEGTQVKYKKGDYWYKKDSRGKEGLTEYLVSKLLTFSDLETSDYILYEPGYINDISGCRSKNFLREREELVTFYRLYYNEFGKDLSQVLAGMESMEERIEHVLRFIKQSCGLDVREYLKKVIMLDMLILNEDRHLNNLAVIFQGDHFICAPIFDNGVSLLTANQSVNWDLFNSLTNFPYFTRLSEPQTMKLYVFSLVFALMGNLQGKVFSYCPTTLSKSLAEVRLASLVAWA